MLDIYIDNKIRIKKEQVSDDLLQDLQDYLTVEVDMYGSEPIRQSFLERTNSHYEMPRGFLSQFVEGLEYDNPDCNRESLAFQIHQPERSYRHSELIVDSSQSISLRPHQKPAVTALLESKVGIYQAPPGSGKTVTALETARRAGLRTLILVDKVSIADQWISRAQQFLNTDLTVGKIADGVFQIEDFTVATKQTLYSRREQLKEDGFFEHWGMVIVDECHHIQADSYQRVIQEFDSEYLLGLSATPHKIPGMEKAVNFMIGDIIHVTTEEELQDQNILQKPKVFLEYTDFEFEYKTWVWGGKQRNNYQTLLKNLVSDEKRNSQIADALIEAESRKVLVITKRLNHIQNIKKLLPKELEEKTYILTGKESREEREEILENLNSESSYIVFSTIADEALDIPSLDTLFLIFPAKQEGLIIQQLGRIERYSKGKKAPIVIDFVDSKCSLLSNQSYSRYKVYTQKKLNILVS